MRDLGGHPTEDGRRTCFGAVVRADSVRQLSEAGWAALVAHGVRTVVDLRHDEELAADPPRELPVDVMHVPLMPAPASPEWPQIDEVADAAPDAVTATRDVYLEILRRRPAQFAAAVRAVAGAPKGGVVVHCLAGKDRTGLLAALLLRLVRVPRDDVAADYALSEANLATILQPWVAKAADELEAVHERLLGEPVLTP